MSRSATPSPTRRRAARPLRWGLLALLCLSGALHAGCLPSDDADITRLESLAERDAHRALQEAQGELSVAERGTPAQRSRRAALYGIEAYANSMLELDADARQAVAQGLALPGAPDDAARLNLLMIGAENVYDQGGLARADADIAAALRRQAPGSLAETCLLITLGRVEFREDRVDLAIRHLTRAYLDGAHAGYERQRVLAAAALSPVLRAAGDFAQATTMLDEVVAWDQAHGLSLDLSVARYHRGLLLFEQHAYEQSIDELEQARAISTTVGDEQGEAFADLRICEAQTEIGLRAGARAHCLAALRVFEAARSLDVVKETRTVLARLDLEAGHPQLALQALDEVLSRGGEDLQPRLVTRLYRLRSRAEAALGRYGAAYQDAARVLEHDEQSNQAERARQVTALRTRFETDREIERNLALQRQLALEREQDRSRSERSLAVGLAGALGVGFSAYIALTGRRHRRELLRLASEDALTGLPNRRHTSELAGAALALATRRAAVLTVAIIDIDHFKLVNDRCGHAEGDRVLQQFAQAARRALRQGDVLGRWGGEEFLLVMNDCPLDRALATLERIRSAAAGIGLPSDAGDLRVTVSAGLATNEGDVRSLQEIVSEADAALYEAKHGGRDLVRIAEQSYHTASTGVRRSLSFSRA